MAGVSDFVRRPTGATVSCANCGAPMGLRTPGITKTLVCDSCGSVLDLSNQGVATVVGKQKAFEHFQTVIPIGARGTLNGQEWEVVGYVQRKAVGWQVVWAEYLLFHPLGGFRWLVENAGHWNLVTPVTDPPKIFGTEAQLEATGERFAQFDAGKAQVLRVIGEFYWRLKVGDVVQTADYIAPPYLLSTERDGSEWVASRGEYVEPRVVAEAFGIDVNKMPKRLGVGMNQPLGWMPDAKWMAAVAAILTLVLTVAQFVITPGTPRELVSIFGNYTPGIGQERLSYDSLQRVAKKIRSKTAGVFQLPPGMLSDKKYAEAKRMVALADSIESIPAPDAKQRTLPPWELGSFTLEKDTRNAQIDLSAGVSNSWASLDLTLFNETTGETFYLSKDIEYYYGGSGEDSWTEGSRSVDAFTHDLTPGDYVATLEGVCDVALSAGVNVKLSIRTNERVWLPYWLALIGIWTLTGFAFIIGYNQEVKRWSSSDYSPYASSESDSDDDD